MEENRKIYFIGRKNFLANTEEEKIKKWVKIKKNYVITVTLMRKTFTNKVKTRLKLKVQFFLACVLRPLLGRPHFHLVETLGFTIGLAISSTVSICGKVVVGFLECSLQKLIMNLQRYQMANIGSQIVFFLGNSFKKLNGRSLVGDHYLIVWHKPHYCKLLQSYTSYHYLCLVSFRIFSDLLISFLWCLTLVMTMKNVMDLLLLQQF